MERVLITGAGPTGLTLANLLAMMDVPFMLIDKNEGPSRDSKAFGIHARTLEVFHHIGAARQCLEQGSVQNTVYILANGKQKARISVENILPGLTRYPWFLILPQNQTEQILVDVLQEKGQQVHWQHELVDLQQEDGRVGTLIRGPGGQQLKMHFGFVAGCDGASSTVREAAGFTFWGRTIDETFCLADCRLGGQLAHPAIYFIFSPGYLSAIFPYREQDSFRVFNFMNPAVSPGPDEELREQDFHRLLASDPYTGLQAGDISWLSVFRIHIRQTGSFRRGNILLAGDAAHVHSPAGAQGMNTAIQDAFNLAWKLALVVRGQAEESLLDSYNQERHGIARKLHATTDRFFRMMISPGTLGDVLRIRVFPLLFRNLFRLGSIRRKAFLRVSQLSVSYPGSSLNSSGQGRFGSMAPRPGDRAPFCPLESPGLPAHTHQLLHPARFTVLLAFSQGKEQQAQNVKLDYEQHFDLPVKVFLLPREQNPDFCRHWGVKQDCMFIIRPDDHVLYRSGL